jgi:sugar phosphate isomerase/epimerase
MRLRHADGQTVHLGYCTNVHPGEDLAEIVAQLDAYAVGVRERLATDVLGVGLWLAAPVAAELAADRAAIRRLRRELDVRGLEVVTFNGFPYRSFHAPVVKHAVYYPDWTTRERLDYTLDLARILVALLPDDAARGSVSTLPLGWRTPWGPAQSEAARRLLDILARELRALARERGRPVRVAFEPEPGCVVETSAQAVTHLSTMDVEYLGVCLDLAHLACAWEEPAVALGALAGAGLPVVKVQVSAALGADEPREAEAVLRAYAEPRFLHQTRSPAGAGTDDLAEALDCGLPGPWRIHYHVPLHAAPEAPLHSTMPVLRSALAALLAGPTAACDHLDVETYTWSVLPPAQRPHGPDQLADGIAAELALARAELLRLGLNDASPAGLTTAGPSTADLSTADLSTADLSTADLLRR